MPKKVDKPKGDKPSRRRGIPAKIKISDDQGRAMITAKIKLSELVKMPFGCAWDKCSEHYFPEKGQPDGWVNLLVWHGDIDDTARMPVQEVAFLPNCYRDSALCPKHAKEFLGKLKGIPPIGKN